MDLNWLFPQMFQVSMSYGKTLALMEMEYTKNGIADQRLLAQDLGLVAGLFSGNQGDWGLLHFAAIKKAF